MQKHFPDTDFTCELVSDVPWNDIANKIGFMHGKYLCNFWEYKIKYLDDEGKLRLRNLPRKIPFKVCINMDLYYCLFYTLEALLQAISVVLLCGNWFIYISIHTAHK